MDLGGLFNKILKNYYYYKINFPIKRENRVVDTIPVPASTYRTGQCTGTDILLFCTEKNIGRVPAILANFGRTRLKHKIL